MKTGRQEVVVVSGASAGVGRAVALRFARKGAVVALLARNRERLESLVQTIEDQGGRALALPLDVSDAAAVFEAADIVERELGPIDVWVNSAMVTVFSPFHEMQPEEFRRVTEVTYLGTVHGTMAAMKHMRSRNHGSIVQVGSALSYRSIPLQSAYCGAKFAIRGFTDSIRAELIHERSNIHLTMVQLAAFNTPQFQWARSRFRQQAQPLPPIFQPEEAARAVVWAAHHRRRELWVGFSSIKAIVGTMLLPHYADHKVAREAWSGQMDNSVPPLGEKRPDNLFNSVDGDYGSHGRFDDQALPRSPQLTLSMNRNLICMAAGFGLLGLRHILRR